MATVPASKAVDLGGRAEATPASASARRARMIKFGTPHDRLLGEHKLFGMGKAKWCPYKSLEDHLLAKREWTMRDATVVYELMRTSAWKIISWLKFPRLFR
ncbi:hypothetical protein LINPERPRIM_LOCUS13145 [Linum perenne]